MSCRFALLPLIGLCLLPWAAGAAGDPWEEWGNARWGMGEDEVRKALEPNEVRVTRYRMPGGGSSYVTIDVDRYEIAGFDFKGQFSLGDSVDGLARITFAHNSDHALACYSELSRRLESRYGKSASEDKAENMIAVSESRRWSVGNASIRTSFSTMRDAREGYCNLMLEGK